MGNQKGNEGGNENRNEVTKGQNTVKGGKKAEIETDNLEKK